MNSKQVRASNLHYLITLVYTASAFEDRALHRAGALARVTALLVFLSQKGSFLTELSLG